MGRAGVDLLCAAYLADSLGRAAEGTGGIDDVVKQDAGLALDVAYDVHDLGLVGLFAALVDDGHVDAELHRESAHTRGAADVGRDDHNVLIALAEHIDEVLYKQVGAEKIVHRDIEEALDLRGVKIHRQHSVRAGGGDKVRDELCGDGIAALGLSVLTGIAEVGNDRGDTACGGSAHRVDHDEQLHEVVVDVVAGGLNNENVLAAHRLKHGNGAFAVGKLCNVRLAECPVQFRTDMLGQFGIGIACEDLDFLAV